MRVIVAVIVAAVLGYAGYWVVASRVVTGQIDRVLATTDLIAAQDVRLSGFPYRFDVRAREVALATQDGQHGWAAPDVTVTALSYRPHHLIGFVTGAQTLRWRGVQMGLNADATQASIVFVPGTDLALARANLVLDAPVLEAGFGATRADVIRAALRGADTQLDLALEGLALSPAAALVAWLDPSASLPPLIARVALDAGITLDAPVSLRGPAAQMQAIDLRALAVDWGALTLEATGTLRVDGPGTLGGQITLQVTGWPVVLDALGRSGAIAPDMLGMAGQMAASMSDPATGVLALPLSITASRVALGPFVLGRLPPF